jgi:hypothetical protein
VAEAGLVAEALRNCGDPRIEALLCPGDDAGWERLKAFAEESGADALVALDLFCGASTRTPTRTPT